MKKKYLALIMACIMCTSVFVTGCGRTSEVVEADDEDDDDEDDDDRRRDDEEDDDDDRDVAPDPVYVEIIDHDTLREQVKVFIKQKNIWSIPNDSGAPIKESAYALTDLDHNGRCELLCMTALSGTNMTSSVVYEISESGVFFTKSDWKFEGLDVSVAPCPDFMYYPFPLKYLDPETDQIHYLMLESIEDESGNQGVCYDDVVYSDGTVISYTYAASLEYFYTDPETGASEYRYSYTTDEGEVEEPDYYEYRYGYVGGLGNTEESAIGVYLSGLFGDFGVMELDDEFLSDMLTDSYEVFTGEKTYSEFYEEYNNNAGYTENESIDFDKCIGTWNLSYLATDGNYVYYEEDGPQYATLSIGEDRTATISQYRDGELSLQFTLDINFDGSGRPYFIYDDRDALPDGFSSERYSIMDMSDDGSRIILYLDFYGEDGFMLGQSMVGFERA